MKLLLLKEKPVKSLLASLVCLFLASCTMVQGGDGKKPVADKHPVWHPVAYDPAKYYIYLSFDDGPQHGTVTCYDLCRKEGVKASFFMVGLHANRKSDGPRIVSMIRDAYPEILLANHSYTHAMGKYNFFYTHPSTAERDFIKAQDSLVPPFRIARLPGNNAWAEKGTIRASWLTKPVSRLLDSAGYHIIGWDLEWHFSKRTERPVQTPEQLAVQVDTLLANNRTHTPHHLVLLAHDRMFRNPADADSLAKFIAILKRNPRYVFETADHYPGVEILVHRP
jgi:peptidoglycan/xylan/chitin deacetylase (PgdA/CDA1 family)